MSIFNGMMATDELQRLTDTLVYREKLREEMQNEVEKFIAYREKQLDDETHEKTYSEPTPPKPQNLDIQAIIDDAMKNKDRYVSILVTNEGHISVNVYPHDEEELCWIRDEKNDRFICPSCGRPSIYQTMYCPHCGEKVKKNT